MFNGTKIWFSLSYFLTAMLPAYLMLTLQLNLGNNRIWNYSLFAFILGIGILIGCFLRHKVKRRALNAPKIYNLSFEIEKRNGSVITFLFGVIMPSLLLPDKAGILEVLVVTFLIQMVCYIIMKRSSDLIPNVVLMMLGIDIYTVNKNAYLFTINYKLNISTVTGNFYRLGDSKYSNIYILESESDLS